ncbi:hypothetical protein C4F50_23930 [Flavobacterium sp. KB82]|uniref:Uncharacterized protein n=1 Tax=Flavobacterium hungaricum TaxID=2082725 RepID=A0ABR9TRI3_9FLAO|nr:hypothetical protein [Flavobacterium hungaricum]
MLYVKLKHKTKEIKELTKLGLINPNWIRNLEIFEKFHFYINDGSSKMDAYHFCSADFKIHWEMIKKIVSKLSK